MISLEKVFKVTPGKPFVFKKLLPKIKIHNLDSLKIDHNEDMKKAILEKNIELRACLENSEKSIFELLFTAKNQNSTPNYAIVKVTPDVGILILATGRIFIEISSYRVSDHLHVEQCYKCQEYGHRSASKLCPFYNSNESVCLYCAKKHKSKSCPVKKILISITVVIAKTVEAKKKKACQRPYFHKFTMSNFTKIIIIN